MQTRDNNIIVAMLIKTEHAVDNDLTLYSNYQKNQI